MIEVSMRTTLSMKTKIGTTIALALAAGTLCLQAQSEDQTNLFDWRGPFQTGVSAETYEGWAFEGEKSLKWTYPLSGRGCPVIVDGRLYSFGYDGDKDAAEQRIVLSCLDADKGTKIWQQRFNDFISDTVYSRYGTGSPKVDKETRNVYLLTSTGLFSCFDKDGNLLWQHSLMESYGRLTFPNGRTGAPVIDGDMVITRGITSFWGSQGPARDRFYAFNKHTGEPLWSAEPGTPPKDSSNSTPVFETRDGKRVFYAGTGCGNIVCVNANTGQSLWRYHFSKGGINSTLSIHPNGSLICIHGKENHDTTNEGRMIALKLPEKLIGPGEAQVVLDESCELWRNDLVAFTSSPCLVGDRAYVIDKTGNLDNVDVTTGKVLWREKLDSDNIHASATYADGILYVPTHNGKFFVIKPSDEKAERIFEMEMEGNCLGAPAVWNGHVYVHTTSKLYCFKMKTDKINYLPVPTEEPLKMGPATAITIVPNEVTLLAGDTVQVTAYEIDQAGVRGKKVTPSFETFIPPTAKVKAKLDATIDGDKLVSTAAAKESAGMFKGTAEGKSGLLRGRLLGNFPYTEDFEGYDLSIPHKLDGVNFAFPPLPWIGARLKWEVRDLDGSKVLTKTLDNNLFQRATSFIGTADMSNYTLQADVMTDGTRRIKSDIGLINQRYLISLQGNAKQIEISSNHERIKHSVPFTVKAKTWYTLKTRVDVQADGSGIVRGKAWIKGEPEPEAWTIEYNHKYANTHGSPGIVGFSPQSQKRVFVDNIAITSNK
ncbi:MAG: outer membrane protein assembly factor BamB [Verrucomicrobiales bacterium]|jgi:outer membrane protein assembly factor BamB